MKTYKISLTKSEYDYLFSLMGRQLGSIIKYTENGLPIDSLNPEEVMSINNKLCEANNK